MKTLIKVTIGIIALLTFIVVLAPAYNWGIKSASFYGTAPESCLREPSASEREAALNDGLLDTQGRMRIDGACWPAVWATSGLLWSGRYPDGERWRASLSIAIVLASVFIATQKKLRNTFKGGFLLLALVSLPILVGGSEFLKLKPVQTELWGGLLLTLYLSFYGIVIGFPIAVLLALARTSEMPVIKYMSTTFIETVRGVPLITLLFTGQFLLPLFLPAGTSHLDPVLRALCVIVIFEAVYLAEVLRGGLLGIPSGQKEAAAALGLGYWKTMRLVLLPQVVRITTPSIISTLIGLVKDTSLVAIIGLFDLLAMARTVPTIAEWLGRDLEPLIAVAIVYWLISMILSRLSARSGQEQTSLSPRRSV